MENKVFSFVISPVLRIGLTVSYFFSFAKYETVRNRSLFRRVSIVSGILKKYEKKCFELFRETEKNIFFRSFVYFHINFVPSLRIVYLLFEFRTFHSRFVPFFRVVYLIRVSYLLNKSVWITTFVGRLTRFT